MQKPTIINISENDRLFPNKLRQLTKTPTSLKLLGNADLLSKSYSVGVVGSRKVTPYGREVTATLAGELARRGIVVISGLALGVDSIAHRASIDSGGTTIAVLPSGIKSIYPASHMGLAQQIVQTGGLLISEYAEENGPMKHQFIERNRIIAALSDVLIITEAAENSGSLHTARFALEQGKSVMSVPGPITSPTSIGTNKLIQAGATPVLSYQDVLDELGLDNPTEVAEYFPENEGEQGILDQIKLGIQDSHQILQAVDMGASEFQTHLTMLEIKGVIAPSGGKWYIR